MEILNSLDDASVSPSQLVLARALAREIDAGIEPEEAMRHVARRFSVSIEYMKLIWALRDKGIISL